MGKCAEFIRERREVGAGALGPGPRTWEVRYGMTGVSAAHRCFQMLSSALMTPVGGPSTASALSGIPLRVKPIRVRCSPPESPQPARPCPGLSG